MTSRARYGRHNDGSDYDDDDSGRGRDRARRLGREPGRDPRRHAFVPGRNDLSRHVRAAATATRPARVRDRGRHAENVQADDCWPAACVGPEDEDNPGRHRARRRDVGPELSAPSGAQVPVGRATSSNGPGGPAISSGPATSVPGRPRPRAATTARRSRSRSSTTSSRRRQSAAATRSSSRSPPCSR